MRDSIQACGVGSSSAMVTFPQDESEALLNSSSGSNPAGLVHEHQVFLGLVPEALPLEVLVRAVGEAWAEAWPAVFWVRPHFPPFRPPCAAYELRGPTKPSHKSKTQAEKAKSLGLKRAKFLARGQCTARFLSSARESSRRVFLTLQFLNAYL